MNHQDQGTRVPSTRCRATLIKKVRIGLLALEYGLAFFAKGLHALEIIG